MLNIEPLDFYYDKGNKVDSIVEPFVLQLN